MKFRALAMPLLATAITVISVGSLSAWAQSKKESRNRDLVHVVQWAGDAKLSRKLTEKELEEIKKKRKKGDKSPLPVYKVLKGVKIGDALEVPDIVETKKGRVTLMGGTLTKQQLYPNSVLRYVRIDPTSLVPSQPAELFMTLEKGTVLSRIGTLAQPSTIRVGNAMTFAAARGTAYSVSVKGDKVTLVVAEGTVQIGLNVAPDEFIEVNPREKVVYSPQNGLPDAPVPVTAADESLIRDILSLSTNDINGYVAGRDIRRPDAEDIVVTDVRQIFRQIQFPISTYTPRWGTPNRLMLTKRDDFWTTDESGKRFHAGPGFWIQDIAPDGSFIIAAKPNQGLWKMNWDGSNRRQITKLPLASAEISPNGRYLVAFGGWELTRATKWDRKKQKEVSFGPKFLAPSGDDGFYFVDIATGKAQLLSARGERVKFVDYQWKDRGNHLIAFLTVTKSKRNGRVVDIRGSGSPRQLLQFNGPIDGWSASPADKWIFGQDYGDEGGATFIRVSDGKVFVHPGVTNPKLLLKEKSFLTESGLVVDIETPGVERPQEEADVPYPDGIENQDISPNGEILAHTSEFDGGSETRGLATFSDSLDLNRGTVSALAVHRQLQTTWLNGYQVLCYTAYTSKESAGRIIISLGVKRKSKPADAVPEKPKEPEADPNNPLLLSYTDDRADQVGEFNVAGINDRGQITVIVKTEDGDMFNGDGTLQSKTIKHNWEADGIPFAIGEDGTYILNGYGQTGTEIYRMELTIEQWEKGGKKGDKPVGVTQLRPTAYHPKKGLVQIPDDNAELSVDPVAMGNGKIVLNGLLWDPWAKAPKPTLEGRPRYGGKIEFRSTPDKTLLTGSGNGTLLFALKNNSGSFDLWIGKSPDNLKRVAKTGCRTVRDPESNMFPSIEPGKRDGLLLEKACLANDGTVSWLSYDDEDAVTWNVRMPDGQIQRYDLNKPLDTDQRMGVFTSFQASKDLAIISGMRMGTYVEGQSSEVTLAIYKGKMYVLDNYLPAGYSYRMIRAVTAKGLLSGSFFKDRKPVIAVWDVPKLLAGDR